MDVEFTKKNGAVKKTAPRQKRPLGKGMPLQIERKGRKKGAKEQAGGKTGRKRWGMMVS